MELDQDHSSRLRTCCIGVFFFSDCIYQFDTLSLRCSYLLWRIGLIVVTVEI